MTRPRSELRNVPDSVHARLLAFAKGEGRDFTQVLNQYFQERLLDRLARLSRSPWNLKAVLRPISSACERWG